MSKESPASHGNFTLGAWGADGRASLTGVGSDRRTALEAALQAVMTLTAGTPEPDAGDAVQSAPIRGEGGDLGALLADLLDELSEQLAYFGAGWHDVTLDGVVRRDDGGLMAWGYVSGTPRNAGAAYPIRLLDESTVEEVESRRVVIRAVLTRDEQG